MEGSSNIRLANPTKCTDDMEMELVDAEDDLATAFYLHYGFTACRDNARRLYLPLGAKKRILW